ncbi:MFS transporter [Actinoplanes sp. CA-030573]|uniref:MFS transporter n=1 Tax=Actinoplanes sp. CA-030573 TaxID=3239898 RepID=UPI003D8D1ABE
MTAYGLTFGGLLLLGGRAADLLGRRRLFLAGLGLFTAASLACGLSDDDTFMIIARGVQGTGAAVVLPAALSIVMSMFDEGPDRNKALGVWGALGAFGATFGLITGGLLTRYLGWEYIFFLNVPIGIAALAVAPRLVPESRIGAARRRYDPLGAATVTGGLLLLVYAISVAPRDGWGSAKIVSLLVAAGVLLAGFVAVEARVAAPLLPLRMVRNRAVTTANAVGLLLGGSFFAYIFIGTLYMQQVLGYSAIETGFAWLATSLTSVVLAGPAQVLVTRVGAGPIMAGGMTLITGGIVLATRVPVAGTFWADLAAGFLVVGAGTAFAFIPISVAGLSGVAERDAGTASGLLNTTQQVGGAVGVAVASTVATSQTGNLLATGQSTMVALTGGFQWAFWACAAIGAAAVPIAVALSIRTAGSRRAAPAPTGDGPANAAVPG